jgi:uncharacterized protein with von Willebrand factor type A (vWA) domain
VLDLPRTLRANLATTRRHPDGRVQVIPEHPIFRSRARRGIDWRLVLVVDVSGSMEASVIWSALTGAILAGVPALTTHFIAFSTEVVDLTDQVSDPLSLLLEVQVGGRRGPWWPWSATSRRDTRWAVCSPRPARSSSPA